MRLVVMKIILLLGFSLFFVTTDAQPPPDSVKRKVFAATGLGFGFPIGGVKKTLSPRVSNTLGFNIPLRDSRYFLYPLIDFMTFGYKQLIKDDTYEYKIDNGSANIYGLSIMPGLNQFLGSLRLYAFAGPFVHLVYEPRVAANLDTQVAKIEDKIYFTGGLRGGVGAHYQLGDFYLFIESGIVRNFSKIEGERLWIQTAHGGLKTDITKLTDKLGNLF